ncbi:MAG TPA: heptaprenyl diphosphate synthase component II [Bacillaceae bacterium]
MKLSMLYANMKSDLDVIEKELENAFHSDSSLLQTSSIQLLKAGGKRIRPVFVLLSAKFGVYDINQVKNAAVALELIHMASLVHDDVIDSAELRRGQPTINFTWDDRIAMYTGDYILARSLEYMTEIENPAAHKILAEAIVEVCIGEIEQIKDKYRYDQTLKDYFRRIKRKTALLIAVSSKLGAVAANAKGPVSSALYRFGYYIGMSYQITDDILDFTGTEEELGKPAGEDLRQGNITLPVLFAMKDPALYEKIIRVTKDAPPEEMREIISCIKRSGAIEQSRGVSRQYLNKALAVLKDLPDNRAKKTLRDIAVYIGKRSY